MGFLFWLQFAIVLACIGIGGRFGGIGLGAAGGLGLGILTFGFGINPSSPPVTVMLIILAVITCVTILQAAGGLDLLVSAAEKMLRKKPDAISFLGPAVTYFFTVLCGTSYVAFSVYPVIAEIATEAKVRPERAMSMAVIGSNFGVVASPMSAAVAGMIAIVADLHITPLQILAVTIPGTMLGCFAGCLFMYKRGAELEDDEEFKRRVESGAFQEKAQVEKIGYQQKSVWAKLALGLFLLSIVAVVTLGSFPSLRPTWEGANGVMNTMSIPTTLQIIMLMTASFIMIFCKVTPSKLDAGSTFKAGLVGVVAIFGLSWMMGAFFDEYGELFKTVYLGTQNPLFFGVIVFVLSIVIYSPSATVAALMPVGALLGLPVAILVGLLPATAGSFIIPGGAQVGCVAFDRTGTTRIGKYVINHSYFLPGMVSTVVSTVACLGIAQFVI